MEYADRNLENLVLAKSLKSDKFLKKFLDFADKTHFAKDSKHARWVLKVIQDFANAHNGERVTRKILFREARLKGKHLTAIDDYLKNLYSLDTKRGTEYAFDEFKKYAVTIDTFNNVETALEVYDDTKDINKARDVLTGMLTKTYGERGFEIIDWGAKGEYQKREKQRKFDTENKKIGIPTGFKELDNIIIGGQKGELFVIVATTGRGKSIFLVNIAHNAVIRGFDVLYITIENSRKQVEQRLDSRFSNMAYNRIREADLTISERREVRKLFKGLRRTMHSNLYVVYLAPSLATTQRIRQIYKDVQLKYQVKPDMVLVDYMDYVKVHGYKAERNDLMIKAAYEDFKSFLTEEDIVGWSASQAKPEFQNKRAYENALKDAYAKATISDGILTLNQSDDDRVKKEMELIVAKMRDNPSGQIIPLKTYYEYMLVKVDKSRLKEEDDSK